jgi:hypothetical protein
MAFRALMESEYPPVSPDILFSVHIPKTGGTTIGKVLKEKFGDSLFLDYPYLEGIEKWERARPIQAVHGHYWLMKYFNIRDLAPNYRVVTFLREPLDRMISNFFYWLHVTEPQDSAMYRRYFLEMKPDLETFLLAPEMANICSKYLMPLDQPEQFWFIGFQETFSEDIARLQEMLGMPVSDQPILNRGKTRSDINISLSVIDRFYEMHWKDKIFYDHMFAYRRKHMSIRFVTVPSLPWKRQQYLEPDRSGSEVKEALQKLENEFHKIQYDYNRVVSSRSWRLTSPLRKIRRFFASSDRKG